MANMYTLSLKQPVFSIQSQPLSHFNEAYVCKSLNVYKTFFLAIFAFTINLFIYVELLTLCGL